MFKKILCTLFLISSSIVYAVEDDIDLNINYYIVNKILSDYYYDQSKFYLITYENSIKNMVNTIDPNHIIFTENDVLTVKNNDFYNFDLKNKLEPFYNTYLKLLKKSNDRIINYIKNFDENNFFSNNNFFDLIIKKYAKDEKYLELRNKEYIQFLLSDYLINNPDADLNIYKEELIDFYLNNKEISFFAFQELFFNSFLSLLDSHTNYLSPYNYKNLTYSFNKVLKNGIGISFEKHKNGILIKEIIKKSPAEKSGSFNVGDIIIGYINSEKKFVSFEFLSTEDISNIIGDDEENSLTFIYINSKNEKKEVTIIKEEINLFDDEDANRILYKNLIHNNKNYGYMKIDAFYGAIDPEDKDIVGDVCDDFYSILKKESQNINGLILDLKDNTGGTLSSSLCILKYLIPEKNVLFSKDTINNLTTHKTEKTNFIFNKPIIVYVNGMSASSTEIFAGVIKEYNRGFIIGSNTFGKGTIQIIASLPYGNLKFTVGKFFLPSGNTVQLNGIKPDFFMPNEYPNSIFGEISNQYYLDSKPLTTIQEQELWIKNNAYKNNKNLIQDDLTKYSLNKGINYIYEYYKLKNEYEFNKNLFSLNLNTRKQENDDYNKKRLSLLKKYYEINNIKNDFSLDNIEDPNLNDFYNELSFIVFDKIKYF